MLQRSADPLRQRLWVHALGCLRLRPQARAAQATSMYALSSELQVKASLDAVARCFMPWRAPERTRQAVVAPGSLRARRGGASFNAVDGRARVGYLGGFGCCRCAARAQWWLLGWLSNQRLERSVEAWSGGRLPKLKNRNRVKRPMLGHAAAQAHR